MPDTVSSFQVITDQRTWYSSKSRTNRAIYKRLKTLQLVLAAAIPVISVAAASDWQRWMSAGLGALIGILEGIAQLGQYQQNWLIYRATSEALKREEFLHSAGAGPYTGIANPDGVFIERCDAIMSGENAKWLTNQQPTDSTKTSNG
jgi:Protein of unknown function (DUF4231)